MIKYWSFFKHLKHIIGANIISTLLFSILELIIAMLIQFYLQISGLIAVQTSTFATKYLPAMDIKQFCIILTLVAVIRLLVEFMMHFTTNYIGYEAVLLLRKKLFRGFVAKPPIATTYTNHLNGTIFTNTSQYIAIWNQFISFSILIFLLLCYMIMVSWKQALICVVLTIFIGKLAFYTSKTTKKYAEKLPQQNNIITQYIRKIGANIFYIHLTKMENTEYNKLLHKSQDIVFNAKKTTLFTSFSSSLTPFLGLLMIISIFFTSHYTFKDQILDSVPFLYLFMRYIQFLSGTTFYYGQLNTIRPDFVEAMEFYKDHAFTYPQSDNHRRNVFNEPITIDFKNVSFGYDQRIIFENASFTIQAGSFVGITGESGIGKSTLFSLLLGYIQPTQGSISINGYSLENFYRQFDVSIGYVGPEPFLFKGSLRENLTYGLIESIDDDQLISVLHEINMQTYASKDQLDYILDEELSNLSTGQKQRICIARVLLSKPSLILLDEFSSNLDQETERSILSQIHQVQKEATVLAISHRPTALLNTDLNLVFQKIHGQTQILCKS
ncbi:MAG: ABC transporter ATP-binding protein [Deltaproteobacteria bacterium]|nr:ABC transporter ATP-binding protein [Deltaproteobacteria bacterium]